MGHYDCRKCGEFRCLGECDKPEVIAEKARAARLMRINGAISVLDKEITRRQGIQDAFEALEKEGCDELVEKYELQLDRRFYES